MLKSKLNNFEIHLQGHFGDSKIRYQLLMCMELAPLGFSLSHCCCSMTRGKLNTGLLKSWVNRWSRIFIRYLINRKYFQDLLILIFLLTVKVIFLHKVIKYMHRGSGVVVERWPRMREIGVRSFSVWQSLKVFHQ